MSGTLFLCATPIGNLQDITPRVIETLRAADVIACEDTRNSRKLFSHFDIKTPFTAYHHHNRYDKARELLAQLKEGKNVALVTDAGMPVISDPGEELVKMCREEGIAVTALPGACALVTALASSGISAARFVFEGFLPGASNKKERRRVLTQLRREERTVVLYEAPHRLRETLEDLLEALGDRELALCRELTKKFEEVRLTTIEEALSHLQQNEPRGEYVLVIAGNETVADARSLADAVVQIASENVKAGDTESGADIALENDAAGDPGKASTIAMENAISGMADAGPAVDSYNGDLRIKDLTGEEVLQILLLQLSVANHVAFYEAKGMDRKDAMKQTARDRGTTKREIYQIILASSEN